MILRFFEKYFSPVISWFRRINIFQRLVASFLLLTTVPCIFLTVFTFQQYVAEVNTQNLNFITLLMHNVSLRVTETMTHYEKLSLKIYDEPELMEILTHSDTEEESQYKVGNYLSALAAQEKDIASLQIVLASGEQYGMITPNGKREGVYFRDIEGFLTGQYYQKALDNKGYPLWLDTTKEGDLFYLQGLDSSPGITDYLTMVRLIYPDVGQQKKEPLGVVVMNLRIQGLTDDLFSYSFYGQGNTFLLSHRDIIAGVDRNSFEPNLLFAQNRLPEYFSASQGQFTEKVDGEELLVVYKLLPYTDIYIAHVVEQRQILASALRIRNICMVLTLVIIIISLLLGILTSVSIANPILSLNDTMTAFIEKEFYAVADESGMDEVSMLSKNFNEMAEATRNLIDNTYVAQINEKTLELSRKTAELDALQMQINPHFLYNTLDLIRWQCLYESGTDSGAAHMITSLSRLMRNNIANDNQLLTIADEILHVENYLEVINFRDAAKITLVVNIPKELCDVPLPRFTFQPLIENAILHGFETEKANVTPEITIGATEEDGAVYLTIRDNGHGIDPVKLASIRTSLASTTEPQKNIGLYNIKHRISLGFGDDYGLFIDSILGNGTQVTIRIPPKRSKGE